MAHLRRFLTGTILFSSISPDYERHLKEELFGCFKFINIPFEELERMPTRDRKAYISLHNKAVQKENEEYEKMSSGGGGKTLTDEATINSFTDQSQNGSLEPLG